MPRNRIKDCLTEEEYIEIFGWQKKRRLPWDFTQADIQPPKKVETPAIKKEVASVFEAIFDEFVAEAARALSGRIEKDVSVEVQKEISALKIENEKLKRKIDYLYKLFLPIAEIMSEEIKLDKKILKEMSELKFEKKDPFVLEKGDWAVSHERLKELLEEE